MGELQGNLGGGASDGRDPALLRISDADRHKVAEILREAAGEGRLDLDELDERLEATFAARTYADLVPITADLPVRPGPHAPAVSVPPPVPAGSARRYETSLAIMSGHDRKGVWEVGTHYNALALMGGITIDLREAIFTSPEVVINASAVMGGVDVVVNARTRVAVDGVGIMGAFEEARSRVLPAFDAHSPLVRVRGLALMAGVTVVRKQMPGEPRPKRRPRLDPPHHRHLPGH
ncbi:hypothetical protein DDE18_16720 [Nocardioides gansuensis]|uniref:DUF1707 domain-containing protein n=1 Tax=Nocardioides gansuensis TaxID=2138300 RepID=A0A2T8F7G1_9ACTN|nr:DUF1707 domain-containing protein [Nocardioides gansuensis]PVG81640.1 hypothetical protein DDE18_16720 [Nocardioides gansuensis]